MVDFFENNFVARALDFFLKSFHFMSQILLNLVVLYDWFLCLILISISGGGNFFQILVRYQSWIVINNVWKLIKIFISCIVGEIVKRFLCISISRIMSLPLTYIAFKILFRSREYWWGYISFLFHSSWINLLILISWKIDLINFLRIINELLAMKLLICISYYSRIVISIAIRVLDNWIIIDMKIISLITLCLHLHS